MKHEFYDGATRYVAAYEDGAYRLMTGPPGRESDLDSHGVALKELLRCAERVQELEAFLNAGTKGVYARIAKLEEDNAAVRRANELLAGESKRLAIRLELIDRERQHHFEEEVLLGELAHWRNAEDENARLRIDLAAAIKTGEEQHARLGTIQKRANDALAESGGPRWSLGTETAIEALIERLATQKSDAEAQAAELAELRETEASLRDSYRRYVESVADVNGEWMLKAQLFEALLKPIQEHHQEGEGALDTLVRCLREREEQAEKIKELRGANEHAQRIINEQGRRIKSQAANFDALSRTAARNARLDAFLSSEEVPEGLSMAVGKELRETPMAVSLHDREGNARIAAVAAWRWFRKELGKAGPEVAAAQGSAASSHPTKSTTA